MMTEKRNYAEMPAVYACSVKAKAMPARCFRNTEMSSFNNKFHLTNQGFSDIIVRVRGVREMTFPYQPLNGAE